MRQWEVREIGSIIRPNSLSVVFEDERGYKPGMQKTLEAENDPWLKPNKKTEASVLQIHGTEFCQS